MTTTKAEKFLAGLEELVGGAGDPDQTLDGSGDTDSGEGLALSTLFHSTGRGSELRREHFWDDDLRAEVAGLLDQLLEAVQERIQNAGVHGKSEGASTQVGISPVEVAHLIFQLLDAANAQDSSAAVAAFGKNDESSSEGESRSDQIFKELDLGYQFLT